MPHVPPPKRHPYDQWSPDSRALDLVGDKWTLLIVRDLAAGPRRFVELQRVLPGISTEQLRSRQVSPLPFSGLSPEATHRRLMTGDGDEEKDDELRCRFWLFHRWGPTTGNALAVDSLVIGMSDPDARLRDGGVVLRGHCGRQVLRGEGCWSARQRHRSLAGCDQTGSDRGAV